VNSYSPQSNSSLFHAALPGGATRDFLVFDGTIQTYYAGNAFQTPVWIVVPDAYPSYPPTAILRPTPDMFIVQGHPNVDVKGTVLLPYLSSWDPRSGSLVDLVAMMSSVFSQSPPLRARPVGPQGPMPASYPPPAYGGMSTPSGSGVPPPRGPYATRDVTPAYNPFNAYQAPAPAPAPVPAPAPAPVPAPGPRTEREIKADLIKQLTPRLRDQMTKTFTGIRDDLDRTNQAYEQLNVRTSKGQTMSSTLQEQATKLGAYAAALDAKIADGQTWIAETQSKTIVGYEPEPASSPSSGASQVVSLENTVAAATPLQNQLLHAVAEDAAIEECYYYLELALGSNRMDGAAMLSTVRDLARQQFRARYLSKKIDNMIYANVSRKAAAAGLRPSALARATSTGVAPTSSTGPTSPVGASPFSPGSPAVAPTPQAMPGPTPSPLYPGAQPPYTPIVTPQPGGYYPPASMYPRPMAR
jgi:hypothetical protein